MAVNPGTGHGDEQRTGTDLARIDHNTGDRRVRIGHGVEPAADDGRDLTQAKRYHR